MQKVEALLQMLCALKKIDSETLMKRTTLEKQLVLLEKLIVLSITGLGIQICGWLLRYLDGVFFQIWKSGLYLLFC